MNKMRNALSGKERIRELPNTESVWASGFCESCNALALSYILSTSVTSGNPCPSFDQDIDGRVYISVSEGIEQSCSALLA